ncbi:MAG: 4Fe-4S binding protein [Deltaproteobacteria bacterium]|nr:4Fe-4S binding protein [Deltaproteobacteria bacterium]
MLSLVRLSKHALALASVLALTTLCFTGRTATASVPPAQLDCKRLDCQAVLPKATSFETVPNMPYQVGKNADGTVVGWVVLSTDVVKIKAYSGKPLVTLVGLDPAGKITGAKVVHHSEPILLVGIPESKLHEFTAFYVDIPALTKVNVGHSDDPNEVTVDSISGATVTVLAQNQTILDSARVLGIATEALDVSKTRSGSFVVEETPWTFAEMNKRGVFGRLTVSEKDMGLPESQGNFVDIWFTLADAPQIGKSILGANTYDWLMKSLKPGEHIYVAFSNGSSTFKGSGFVRGGLFDRIRVEQGIHTLMFRDTDYTNLSGFATEDAPEFKEGAAFIARGGKLDPGASFDTIFLGSSYSGNGGFDRDFSTFREAHQLPSSVYKVEGGSNAMWVQAWRSSAVEISALVAFLLSMLVLFARHKSLTAKMARLKQIHLVFMTISVFGLGFWLRAQPSVTQVFTFAHSVVFEWDFFFFLNEPMLFISWTYIAIVIVLWGRGVFCGWVCPFGSLSELIYKTARFLKIPEISLPEKWHNRVRYGRYFLLIALVATFFYSSELGEQLAEVEPFKTTFFVLPWTRQGLFLGWWLVLLFGSLFTYRPFCVYLCPLGAALAVPSVLRRKGPQRRSFCESCTICTKGCEPRAIRDNGRIDATQCLSCMECEANYNDNTVCPPLVGLVKLEKGVANPAKKAKLLKQVEDVLW